MKLKLYFAVLTTLFIITHSTSSHAQKVSLDENKVDKFSGVTKKTSTYTALASKFTGSITVAARSVGTSYQLIFRYAQPSSYYISEGTYVYLLLEDDAVVKLKCKIGGTAKYESVANMTNWYGYYYYDVDPADFEALTTKAVKSVRIEINGNEDVDFDTVKKRNQYDVKDCLLLVK